MKYSYFTGIDISKNHVDIELLSTNAYLSSYRCDNTTEHIKKVLQELDVEQLSEVLICAEHTGMYSYNLLQAAAELGLPVWLEHPTQLILSSGLQRGKDDVVDARRIAEYARRFSDRARLSYLGEESIEQLSYLISERRLLVADRGKYKALLSDQKAHMPAQTYSEKALRLHALITCFDQQIQQVEQRMEQIIASHPVLSRQNELLQSIPGVGRQLAGYMLVTTEGFTRITNARKLCCHAGIAPFRYHSGENTYSKARVSHRADKQLKSLLHMGALSAIRSPGELQEYYQRKVQQGKPKMSVINAIRSKLVHRMFAVIKRDEEYVSIY